MSNKILTHEILSQIITAIERINRRFKKISSSDDFLDSDLGLDQLDAICMMLIAIGESLKNLDRITDQKLLTKYPDVDWKGAKGMRDIISHHYFDLNAELVFDVCENKIPTLIQTIKKMVADLNSPKIYN